MNAAAFVRLTASVLMLAALFWAANGTLFLFNHPTFRGEATLAIVACLLLTIAFFWSAGNLLRWTWNALR